MRSGIFMQQQKNSRCQKTSTLILCCTSEFSKGGTVSGCISLACIPRCIKSTNKTPCLFQKTVAITCVFRILSLNFAWWCCVLPFHYWSFDSGVIWVMRGCLIPCNSVLYKLIVSVWYWSKRSRAQSIFFIILH